MAPLLGLKPLNVSRCLGNGLPRKTNKPQKITYRKSQSYHVARLQRPRPLKGKPLPDRLSDRVAGMGSGSLLPFKRATTKIQCIARPSRAEPLRNLTSKAKTALSNLKDSLNAKINSSSADLKSFLLMTVLFATMAFINTIVNNLSLSLVITAPMGSAGVISFLTVYAALPLTIGATLLYTYASHFIPPRRLFTITIGLFAATNLLFALCILPNHEALHLPGVADALAKFLPSGLNGAVGMVRNWTFSAFYCLSEMWGDLGISLLFWGFANDVTTSKQAPILYPLMGIGANVAQILGGRVLKAYSVGGAAAFSSSFQSLLLKLVGCMVVVMALHHFLANRAEEGRMHLPTKDIKRIQPTGKDQTVHAIQAVAKTSSTREIPRRTSTRNKTHPALPGSLRDQRHLRPCQEAAYPIPKNGVIGHAKLGSRDLNRMPIVAISEKTKSKTRTVVKKETKPSAKPTFMQTMRSLGDNPIVKSLGIMTVAQALAVTLMEFVWKSHCKVAYPTPAAFSAFMGDVATYVGVLTCAMMVLSPILFDRIGWKGVAGITPVLMTIGGVAFFGMSSAFHILSQMGMTHIAQQLLPMTVIGGAFLFVLSRGTKFSLFKPSEEIIFINMKADERQKAKATVDVLGASLGKSGGSVLQQALLVALGGHLSLITPVMFGVYMVMMGGWNRAVNTLSVFQSKASPEKATSEESEIIKSHKLQEESMDDILSTAEMEPRGIPIKGIEEEPMSVDSTSLKAFPVEVFDEEAKQTFKEAEDEYVSLSQCTLPWDEDRESVGSSVVEFHSTKDLDDYPAVDEVVA